ncbi:MAG: DUF1993 domain-containing protein [Congregibacter sp.]|nr:DUF1993 domain-containing protein [Congregibacter sp.]
MTISLYDASVASYIQTLESIAKVLDKGAQFAASGDLDLEKFVGLRLRDDMAPLGFQLISVWHHSLGAVRGLQTGEFGPPPKMGDMDYAKLRALVDEAVTSLRDESPDTINALAGNPVVFKMGATEIPFTATNFILSFSLPNFYFHATTSYDILRMQGVPLGKIDFLGRLRVTSQRPG